MDGVRLSAISSSGCLTETEICFEPNKNEESKAGRPPEISTWEADMDEFSASESSALLMIRDLRNVRSMLSALKVG
ncbi:hypothetical protein DSECCO2_533990 [anaerobic digester metagenome]